MDRKRAGFVHLRVKSAYSLLEGALRPYELAGLARDAGMPAVAVTDVNNLFGVYELSDTLAKAGVQPIVGCLLSVELEDAAPTIAVTGRQNPPAAAAAGAERSRLSQPHQAAQRGLSRGRAGRLSACEGADAGAPCR